MQFDWALAIERNRRDILRILAELFALVGLDFDAFGTASGCAPHGAASCDSSAANPETASGPDGPDLPPVLPATLPRHLYVHVRRILRSAESAVRRLIVIAARDVAVTVRHAPAREAKEGRAGGEGNPPFSPGGRRWMRAFRECPRTDEGVSGAVSPSPDALRAPPSPARGEGGSEFPVTVTIRPERPLPPGKPAESATRIVRVPVDLGLANIRILPEPGPEEDNGGDPAPLGAIRAFPLVDPRKRFGAPRAIRAGAVPRLACLGATPLPVYLRRPPLPEPAAPMPDDPVPAAALLRRLISVRMALGNIGREARRLARHEARRRHRPPDSRKIVYAAMRPGLPPGWRRRNRYEIDEVLKECRRLAFWATEDDP
ncbi:MAG: hypothetical protein Kow0026_04850 [Oricola sp.]